MKYWTIFLVALCIAAPAKAEWHEASSDHFVIYSNSRANDIEDFAMKLERYHRAMELMTGRRIEPPSPSNRVTIFAVGSDRNLRDLYGDRDSSVAGFYVPRAGASRAFVPNIKIGSGEPDFSFTVLLHEYAHHFLIASSPHAMPRWLSEGAAEFFASARFPQDGSVQIGLPANHRAYELGNATEVSLRELLDPELYEKKRGRRYDAFYGRSWLLYHYLAFNAERTGQLSNYWRAIAGGMPSLEAAELVFGDLDVLESQLDSYLRQRRMKAMSYSPEEVPIGQVSVRKMSAGMGDMMMLNIHSQRGVSEEEALELLPKVREVAAHYPGDAEVLAALAEAEHDAGNDSEAVAAADRALAIEPGLTDAYVQKGLALFELAENAGDKEAAYKAALAPFTALNGLENDHPLPLIYFYRSYAARGMFPPESARHALERASQLALFDQALAMETALMQASEGKVEIASYTLAPLAANPHGGTLAAQAKALISALKDAPEGKPFNAGAALTSIADDTDKSSQN